jgi:hypothetical protein
LLDLPFDAGLLLRFWLPDDRVFEEAERALLFDDAGGEDVRVAMLANVHKSHTSPRLPTPGSSLLWSEAEAGPDERGAGGVVRFGRPRSASKRPAGN